MVSTSDDDAMLVDKTPELTDVPTTKWSKTDDVNSQRERPPPEPEDPDKEESGKV